jgi:hypothetical protein
LGRAPATAEHESTVARLDPGALRTETLALAIVESNEYASRMS